MSLQETKEDIDSFFAGDTSLIETFIAACDDMVDLDNEILIRTNREIIGASKPREFYRFYVSNTDGKYFISIKAERKKSCTSGQNPCRPMSF